MVFGHLALVTIVRSTKNKLVDYVTNNKHKIQSKGVRPRAGKDATYILFELETEN